MTISNFRANEALYVIIVREKNAEQLLKSWAKSANCQVQVENNRMKIFDHRSLSMFQMTWTHGYDNVTVWDAWNKRHIDLE